MARWRVEYVDENNLEVCILSEDGNECYFTYEGWEDSETTALFKKFGGACDAKNPVPSDVILRMERRSLTEITGTGRILTYFCDSDGSNLHRLDLKVEYTGELDQVIK